MQIELIVALCTFKLFIFLSSKLCKFFKSWLSTSFCVKLKCYLPERQKLKSKRLTKSMETSPWWGQAHLLQFSSQHLLHNLPLVQICKAHVMLSNCSAAISHNKAIPLFTISKHVSKSKLKDDEVSPNVPMYPIQLFKKYLVETLSRMFCNFRTPRW